MSSPRLPSRHALAITAACLLLAIPMLAAAPRITFTRQVIDQRFYAEGIAVADFNRDGRPDLLAGPLWFEGPTFKRRNELRAPLAYDKESYADTFIADAFDVDGDGLPDAIQIGWPGRPALWSKNPGGRAGDWPRHVLHPEVGTESPHFVPLLSGRPDVLIFAAGRRLGYAARDEAVPTAPWHFHPITPEGEWQRYTHGIGAGDVNGDGRPDLLCHSGWWEQPPSLQGDPAWRFHPAPFGAGGAQMYVFDVNGDGRADVITSIEAHKYGVSWFEQLPPAPGATSPGWREHVILDRDPAVRVGGVQFSQPHALVLADIDGDGLPDLVTGKRHWAHGSKGDPEPTAPAVLHWFRLVRDPATGGARFEPHLIDDDSGVGTQFVVTDLDGDDLPDIAVANKRGVFAFFQRRTP